METGGTSAVRKKEDDGVATLKLGYIKARDTRCRDDEMTRTRANGYTHTQALSASTSCATCCAACSANRRLDRPTELRYSAVPADLPSL